MRCTLCLASVSLPRVSVSPFAHASPIVTLYRLQQMVCWAAAEAEPVAADDAKDIRWMTLPQLRGVNVRTVMCIACMHG